MLHMGKPRDIFDSWCPQSVTYKWESLDKVVQAMGDSHTPCDTLTEVSGSADSSIAHPPPDTESLKEACECVLCWWQQEGLNYERCEVPRSPGQAAAGEHELLMHSQGKTGSLKGMCQGAACLSFSNKCLSALFPKLESGRTATPVET